MYSSDALEAYQDVQTCRDLVIFAVDSTISNPSLTRGVPFWLNSSAPAVTRDWQIGVMGAGHARESTWRMLLTTAATHGVCSTGEV